MHAADLQSLNVYYASYYSSMLTSSNWASLGEPLQTLSELVIGASLSEPHTYEFAVCPPTLPVWIYMYIYIYVCILYLGQQFGQRFRCLARSFVSLKDGNAFKDVWDVQRKTWMPFSRRAMRLFVHVDVSFD